MLEAIQSLCGRHCFFCTRHDPLMTSRHFIWFRPPWSGSIDSRLAILQAHVNVHFCLDTILGKKMCGTCRWRRVAGCGCVSARATGDHSQGKQANHTASLVSHGALIYWTLLPLFLMASDVTLTLLLDFRFGIAITSEQRDLNALLYQMCLSRCIKVQALCVLRWLPYTNTYNVDMP